MNIFNWFAGYFSNRFKAAWLYKRGMKRAKRHNHHGAIGDYTSTIGMLETPTDMKALAYYNRAQVYVAAGDDSNGVLDLDSLLALKESMVNLKTTARQKLIEIQFRLRESKV